MIIKCSCCGEQLEINGEIQEGRKLICPVCGGKFVYTAEPKAKLGIRRPSQNFVDVNAEAMKQRMVEEEQERKMEQARKETAELTASRKALTKTLLVWVPILIVIIAGGIWSVNWNNKRIATKKLVEEKVVKEEQAAAELRKQEKLEGERQQEEYRKKREEEIRLREEQNRKENEENERKRLAELEERRAADEAKAKAISHYYDAWNSFKKKPLNLGLELPKEIAPKGTYYSIVVSYHGERSLYEVTPKEDGTLSVRELSHTGNEQECAEEAYKTAVNDNGALIQCGDTNFFVAPVANAEGWEIPEGSVLPAQMYMREAYFLISDLRLDSRGLDYVVSIDEMRPKGRKKLSCEIVKSCTECLTKWEVVQELGKLYREEIEKKFTKPPKITVKYYDGNLIKRVGGGVTLIPRTMQRVDRNYERLCVEANKQQIAYENWQNECNRQLEEEAEKYVDSLLKGELKLGIKFVREAEKWR